MEIDPEMLGFLRFLTFFHSAINISVLDTYVDVEIICMIADERVFFLIIDFCLQRQIHSTEGGFQISEDCIQIKSHCSRIMSFDSSLGREERGGGRGRGRERD